MSRLMGLYAQHLDAPTRSPYADNCAYEVAVARAADLLTRADAVVVGIGSGMSSSCGYDHYHHSSAFDEGGPLERFRRAHGFDTLMDGFYHLYATNEERWAYLAAYATLLERAPLGGAYLRLRELLEGKDFFVLTTNVDGQVRRAFQSERTWLFQGDFGYLQCCQPCCDRLSPMAPVADAILASLGETGTAAPNELLPRCSRCGWLMEPWVRDERFLEGDVWREARDRYERFVSQALSEAGSVLFLELGVGGMTPSVIEMPFWRMVRANSNASYLRINVGKKGEPLQLEGRSHTVTADISCALDDIAAVMVKE